MYEIEHKYLVNQNKDFFKLLLESDKKEIKQGYIIDDSKKGVLRVRITDEKNAYLTYKKATNERGKNIEIETEISLNEAHMLMDECERKIDKVRYILPHENNYWEIDVFNGKLKGLIVAELEIEDTHFQYKIPDWISNDVTDIELFSNYNLAKCSINDLKDFYSLNEPAN